VPVATFAIFHILQQEISTFYDECNRERSSAFRCKTGLDADSHTLALHSGKYLIDGGVRY